MSKIILADIITELNILANYGLNNAEISEDLTEKYSNMFNRIVCSGSKAKGMKISLHAKVNINIDRTGPLTFYTPKGL